MFFPGWLRLYWKILQHLGTYCRSLQRKEKGHWVERKNTYNLLFIKIYIIKPITTIVNVCIYKLFYVKEVKRWERKKNICPAIELLKRIIQANVISCSNVTTAWSKDR